MPQSLFFLGGPFEGMSLPYPSHWDSLRTTENIAVELPYANRHGLGRWKYGPTAIPGIYSFLPGPGLAPEIFTLDKGPERPGIYCVAFYGEQSGYGPGDERLMGIVPLDLEKTIEEMYTRVGIPHPWKYFRL